MIAQVCGNFTKAYEKVFFQELNRNLVREPKSEVRYVKLPACVKWRKDPKGQGVAVKAIEGDTLDTLLQRKVGRSASHRLGCSSDVQSSRCDQTYGELVRKLNPSKNFDDLRAGEIVYVPLTTELTTFRVQQSPAAVPASHVVSAIHELAKQGGAEDALITNTVASPVWLLRPPAVDDEDQVCSSAKSQSSRPWPYDASAVAAVIGKTLETMKELGDVVTPTTVTVLDTGLADTFPPSLLRRNKIDPENAYGIGTYRRDTIKPFEIIPRSMKSCMERTLLKYLQVDRASGRRTRI